MKSILIGIVLFMSGSVWASDQAGCLPADGVNQVLQDFNIVQWSSTEGRWDGVRQVDLCQSDDMMNRIVKSILYMQQTPKAGVNSGLQSIVMQEGPLQFFKSRIKTIFVETEAHSRECLMGGVVAYVDLGEHNSMHICPEETKRFSTSLMMSYILLHEARHIDGFGHTKCEHGALGKYDASSLGSGGCDPDFETQGSYGIGAAFLLDIYQAATDPVEKQAARSNAVIDLMQRFNKLPLGLK
ncbi:MAG: hypothetical protein H7256_13445, partial [Bdellovibrio sp.]|nr:hypothetical protein [Bdellovibrio sp.]